MHRDIGYESLFNGYWEGYKSKGLWGEGRRGEREAGTEEKKEWERARRNRDCLFSSRIDGGGGEQMGDLLASEAGKRRLGVGKDHLLKGQGN